jgi:predicted amidohydrolase YtcJ
MLILHNGLIRTLDANKPTAEAIAIEQGGDNSNRVLAVGTFADLKQEFPNARMENLEGRIVLPGLIDAHLHLRQYGMMLQALDCRTASRQECIERVAQRAAKTKPGEWILGHGWQQNDWLEGFGNAALIDTVAPHNPVFLTAASLHSAWVNTAALKAAGITSQTEDPPNGRIERKEDGSPTGILFEEAIALVSDEIPKPTDEQIVQMIDNTQATLWKYGLTGVHDFDREECFRALQTLHQRNKLRLRTIKSIPVENMDHAIGLGLQSGFGDDMLRVGNIKVFADGALGPRTAAMFEAYEGEPENRGMLFVDSEQLLEWSQTAVLNGLAMTVHAIGDRANHEVLNAFEQLRKIETDRGLPMRRHRIEHVQLLHPNDVHRLGQLKLIASMQPIHAISDMAAADKYWGPRTRYSYAWKTQLDAGATLAFGSDAPVESPNPWLGIHAAVTRQRGDGSATDKGWHPEQCLSLDQALAGFTSGPAYAAGMEGQLGKLSPGMLADLAVYEEDPFLVVPTGLQYIKPTATMVGGEWVWQR